MLAQEFCACLNVLNPSGVIALFKLKGRRLIKLMLGNLVSVITERGFFEFYLILKISPGTQSLESIFSFMIH